MTGGATMMKSSYASMEEAVLDMFLTQVVSQPKKKIKNSMMLKDFCPDKKFEKEFIGMYLDRVQTVFGVSIRNLQNKPMVEILAFLCERKRKDALYGNRPFKR
jgi:hypothetical protein